MSGPTVMNRKIRICPTSSPDPSEPVSQIAEQLRATDGYLLPKGGKASPHSARWGAQKKGSPKAARYLSGACCSPLV